MGPGGYRTSPTGVARTWRRGMAYAPRNPVGTGVPDGPLRWISADITAGGHRSSRTVGDAGPYRITFRGDGLCEHGVGGCRASPVIPVGEGLAPPAGWIPAEGTGGPRPSPTRFVRTWRNVPRSCIPIKKRFQPCAESVFSFFTGSAPPRGRDPPVQGRQAPRRVRPDGRTFRRP